jgi:hypothetical protein
VGSSAHVILFENQFWTLVKRADIKDNRNVQTRLFVLLFVYFANLLSSHVPISFLIDFMWQTSAFNSEEKLMK